MIHRRCENGKKDSPQNCPLSLCILRAAKRFKHVKLYKKYILGGFLFYQEKT